jgi:hypothetical protein
VDGSVEERDSGTGGSPDAGVVMDAGAFDGGQTQSGPDAELMLSDAGELPPGRIRCYFGPRYNCTRDGEACCEASQLCYFPDMEPDFCPE